MTTTNTASKTKLNLRFSFITAIVRLLSCYRYYSSFAAPGYCPQSIRASENRYFPTTPLFLIFDKS